MKLYDKTVQIGPFPVSFLFSTFSVYDVLIKIAHGKIRTGDLWCRIRALCQLRQTQCPFLIVFKENIFEAK